MVLSWIDNVIYLAIFFFSAVYEENVHDVHSYWKEYFKVFLIIPRKVCNFYSLLSTVDVLGDIFDLF